MQRIFGDVERNVDLLLQALVETAQQSAATTEVDAVLHDVGIKLRRSVLKSREHSVLDLCDSLVEAVSNLLIAYRHLHWESGDAVRTVNDEVLRCLVAKLGESRSDVNLDTLSHTLRNLHVVLA